MKTYSINHILIFNELIELLEKGQTITLYPHGSYAESLKTVHDIVENVDFTFVNVPKKKERKKKGHDTV